MTVYEMEGFLRGKCVPGDLKVNETNAEYLVRKFAELESKLETALRECRSAGITIDNLESKCEALAAENAGLKKFCEDAAFDADYESELLGERGGFVDGLSLVKTPATDAFLAEVRAQAFNDLCAVFVKDANLAGMDDGDIVTVKEATDAMLYCAEQLSKR